MTATSLPRAHGDAVLARAIRTHARGFLRRGTARLRAQRQRRAPAADVEKRGMNTAFAAKRIAQWAGVRRNGAIELRRPEGPPRRHPPALQRAPAEERRAGPGGAAEVRRACACSSTPGTRASCRAARWPATASCWCCASVHGERDAIEAAPAGDRRARRAQLFRRAALRPRGRQRRPGAGDVRRPPRAPRAAHAAAVGGAFGAVQPRAGRARACRQLGAGAGGRGLDAGRQPQRVRSGAV